MVRKVMVIMVALYFLTCLGGVASAENKSQGVSPGVSGMQGPEHMNNSCGWTNAHFADFLATKYGIKTADNLSAADKYKAQADALSMRGIAYFLGANPGAMAQCCDVANVLYSVIGVKAETDTGSCDLQYDYLVKNGYLSPPSSGANSCEALCDVESVFNNPLVIQKFSVPPATTIPNPPTETPERPASRI